MAAAMGIPVQAKSQDKDQPRSKTPEPVAKQSTKEISRDATSDTQTKDMEEDDDVMCIDDDESDAREEEARKQAEKEAEEKKKKDKSRPVSSTPIPGTPW